MPSLEPAEPGAASHGQSRRQRADPVSAGKAAAAGCAGCHGEAGITKMPGMPSLVGLDPKYLVAAMNAYKSGQRKHDMMKTLVSALSDADMNNIALFYAPQKPGKAQTPAPGNQAAGKAAAAACAGCHGEAGVSTGRDAEPCRPGCAVLRGRHARLQGWLAQPTRPMKGPAASVDDDDRQEPGGLLREPAAAAAESARPSPRPTGAAVRSLPWRQRQQHRSALAGPGGAARRLSGRRCAPTGKAARKSKAMAAMLLTRGCPRRDRAAGRPITRVSGRAV